MRYCLRRETSENVSGNVANVGRNDPTNRLNVNDWDRANSNDNVFAVPVIVSRKRKDFRVSFAWWLLSIRQASCLFHAASLGAQDSFYWLMQGYLLQVLKGFLKGQSYYLFYIVFLFYYCCLGQKLRAQKCSKLCCLVFDLEYSVWFWEK